jgi:hypothetical protein
MTVFDPPSLVSTTDQPSCNNRESVIPSHDRAASRTVWKVWWCDWGKDCTGSCNQPIERCVHSPPILTPSMYVDFAPILTPSFALVQKTPVHIWCRWIVVCGGWLVDCPVPPLTLLKHLRGGAPIACIPTTCSHLRFAHACRVPWTAFLCRIRFHNFR